jgi:hypothetical protein
MPMTRLLLDVMVLVFLLTWQDSCCALSFPRCCATSFSAATIDLARAKVLTIARCPSINARLAFQCYRLFAAAVNTSFIFV